MSNYTGHHTYQLSGDDCLYGYNNRGYITLFELCMHAYNYMDNAGEILGDNPDALE